MRRLYGGVAMLPAGLIVWNFGCVVLLYYSFLQCLLGYFCLFSSFFRLLVSSGLRLVYCCFFYGILKCGMLAIELQFSKSIKPFM